MEFIRSTVACLFGMGILLSACASGPTYRERQGALAPIPANMGRIVVYRDDRPIALTIQPQVLLNGARMGQAKPGSVFFQDVPPGAHRIAIGASGDERVRVDVGPGDIRYIELRPSLGFPTDRIDLVIKEPAVGYAQIQSLHLSTPAANMSQQVVAGTDQAALAAPFRCPAPGTTMVTSVGRLAFTRGDGWTCRFTTANGDQAGQYAAFWSADGRWAQERPDTIEKLWPLQVGNRIAFVEAQDDRTWEYRYEVMRREPITVPAGAFDTYVIRYLARSDTGVAERLLWYAPELGYFVKTQWQGSAPKNPPDWEAQSVVSDNKTATRR